MWFNVYWRTLINRLKRNYLYQFRLIKRKRVAAQPQPCIQCHKCVPVCPAHLLPQKLFWHIQGNDLNRAENLGLLNCIECHLCEQVCPSDIPLVTFYQQAKSTLEIQQMDAINAQKAKQFYATKQARLEKKSLALQAKKKNIQDALERVKGMQ